jgi:hypothetical protein
VPAQEFGQHKFLATATCQPRSDLTIELRRKHKSLPRISMGRRVARLEGERSALQTNPSRAVATAGRTGRDGVDDCHAFCKD